MVVKYLVGKLAARWTSGNGMTAIERNYLEQREKQVLLVGGKKRTLDRLYRLYTFHYFLLVRFALIR